MSDLVTVEMLERELGVQREFLDLLVEARLVRLQDGCLTLRAAERVRVAWTLHHELGVNLAGIEVILPMLDRMEAERTRTRQRLLALRALLERLDRR